MSLLLPLLAIIGVLGVGRFLLRSAFALVKQLLESYVARTVADARAKRGDLTGLHESSELRRQQRPLKLRRWSEFLGLLALILIPPLTPYMLMVYATYIVFWIPSLHSRGKLAP